jgi:hypothetical protein
MPEEVGVVRLWSVPGFGRAEPVVHGVKILKKLRIKESNLAARAGLNALLENYLFYIFHISDV